MPEGTGGRLSGTPRRLRERYPIIYEECLRVCVRRILQLPTSLTSRRGRYSCGFDLCLSPTRSLDGEGLQTAQHRWTRSGRSRKGVDSAWKDVGNCKPAHDAGDGLIPRLVHSAVRTAPLLHAT